MARQIKKPVVYRRHEIDPSGTGVRCMDVAPIPEVAPSASANTGSPKLADEVLEAIRCVNRGDYESCINVLSGVVGQLRASA